MKKSKVIIVGAGKMLYALWPTIISRYEVVTILDNNVQGKIFGHEVLALEMIVKYLYDLVLILPIDYMFELKRQLLGAGVTESKIIPYIGESETLKLSDFCFEHGSFKFNNGNIKFELNEVSGNGGIRGIYFENLYNIQVDDTESNMVVIDIGANIGLSSLYFASRFNVKKVIGFEPFLENFNMARKNFMLNSSEIQSKIEIYNIALGSTNEDKVINVDQKRPTTYSVCDNSESLKEEGELIHIKKADEVLKPIFTSVSKDSNSIIVVKLDCEGSEYNIFECFQKSGLISMVDVFVLEFHREDNSIIEKILRDNRFWYFKLNTSSYIGFMYAFNTHKSLVGGYDMKRV